MVSSFYMRPMASVLICWTAGPSVKCSAALGPSTRQLSTEASASDASRDLCVSAGAAVGSAPSVKRRCGRWLMGGCHDHSYQPDHHHTSDHYHSQGCGCWPHPRQS